MTQAPANPDLTGTADVVLSPGDFWFGGGHTRIRTLLGSCVSITMWHPRTRLGGMCHYMLPTRTPIAASSGRSRRPAPRLVAAHNDHPDGRYADEAMGLFLDHIEAARTSPDEYVVKLFGGGNQFPHRYAGGLDVPDRNVEAGLRLLETHGLQPAAMHLGGAGHRVVVLDLATGIVWLKHLDPAAGTPSRAGTEAMTR